MARFHTNQGNLRIVLAQVEDCELPKDFIGRPNGDSALVRPFIGLCLCGDIQSNPGIVVDSIIARMIIAMSK